MTERGDAHGVAAPGGSMIKRATPTELKAWRPFTRVRGRNGEPRPKDRSAIRVGAQVKALLVTFAAALLLVACATEPPPRAPPREAQSYGEAVRILCEVDALAGVDAEDPLDAEAKRSEYLALHVKNSDGIYLLTLFRTSDPRGQASLLDEAARETACQSCPLLSTLRASSTP